MKHRPPPRPSRAQIAAWLPPKPKAPKYPLAESRCNHTVRWQNEGESVQRCLGCSKTWPIAP